MPQDVEPISSKVHIPPRVVVESIPSYLSAAQIVLTQSSLDRAAGCHCQLELEVPIIEMDDPTAPLVVRWFVDYDETKPATQLPKGGNGNTIQGTGVAGATLRPGPKFTFDLGTLNLAGDGTHVVDVVIAEDGAFDDGVAPLNRAMKEGYSSAVQRFVVSVVTDDTVNCPSVVPSTRICQADGGSP
ncbi:MAG: hypothetical protein JST92_24645 [Deltaproteobacteria bacterium]|nr:hypothetical protein [Deltaproteobacteria bacterium]